MESLYIRAFIVQILMGIILVYFPAQATGPVGPYKIVNIRNYLLGNYGVIFQLKSPSGNIVTFNSACSYGDNLTIYLNQPNYQTSAALVLSAYMAKKKIRIWYEGCGETNTAAGSNIFVTGISTDD